MKLKFQNLVAGSAQPQPLSPGCMGAAGCVWGRTWLSVCICWERCCWGQPSQERLFTRTNCPANRKDQPCLPY